MVEIDKGESLTTLISFDEIFAGLGNDRMGVFVHKLGFDI